MAFTTAIDKITALYVGYFDRAPDPAGLSYWIGRLNAGMSLNDIANSFAAQPEATQTYAFLAAPNLLNATTAGVFIDSIYLNLFNHVADLPGKAYWTNQLLTGAVSPGLMIEAIIGGALGTDATIMTNKVHAGEDYANAFASHNDTWTTADDTASAHAALAGGTVFGATYVQVDATQASVDANKIQSNLLATALQTNPHQAVISATPTSINSGSATDVSLSEAPSQHGAAVTYTITGVNPNEINGPTTGSILLNSQSQGALHIDTIVLASLLGSANETMTVTADGVSTNVTIAHGSQTITPSTNLVNEGSTFTVDIGTTLGANAAGLVESYVITGTGLSQIPVADRAGTVTLDSSGHFILNIHTLATVFNSSAPNPTVTVTVNGSGSSGASTTVTINEVATQTITASNINEGQTALFSIATQNVAGAAVAGTVETWALTGDAFVLGQIAGPHSGSFSLDSSGSQAVSVPTSLTVFNVPGNAGTLTMTVSLNGAPVVTKNITVNEATMAVSGNTADEGTPVTFTVTTNGVVPAGTTFHYHLSGAALGNIAPANQTGSFVISAGGVTNIVLPTLANVPGGGVETLTLTVDEVASASGNATINETAPFILTTGTDAGPAFTGASGAGANNVFLATAAAILGGSSTLGQNDVLTGGTGGATNTLNLTISGFLPLLVTNFTTNGIEKFVVNANNLAFGGTTVDLSGTSGLTSIIDANSGGTVVFTNATGPVNDLELVNPTDLGVPVNLGLIYQIGAAPGTQNVTLDPVLSPLTGLPNSRITVNVQNFNIASNGPGTNGLVALNAALPGTGIGAQNLSNVAITGNTSFVNGLNGSGVAAMNFNGSGSHSLDLSGFSGQFYNVGSATSNTTAGINNNGNTLTITGGSNSFLDDFFPTTFPGQPAQFGGSASGLGATATITSVGTVNVVINQGTFFGQQVLVTGGGAINVTGGVSPSGGFLGNFNAAALTTTGGGINIQGFSGGLGNSVGFPVFITTNGGGLAIGTSSVVTGNIFANISTGGGTATIRLSQGTNSLDFQAGTGFHVFDSVFTDGGPLGNNTLILNANALGGTASGVQTINFNSGNFTTAGTINISLLNQSPALVPQQTINLNGTTLGATGPSFSGILTTDIINVNLGGTYTFDTGMLSANAVLNLNVVGGSSITLKNTLNGGNNLGTLNFGAGNSGTTTLTLLNDNGLNTLNMTGTNVTIGTTSAGTGTISTITGGNASYDLRGLVGVNVSGAYAGGLASNIQGTNANANANLLAAAGTIMLGSGNDLIAIGGGSWNVNAGNGNNNIVVNPTFTQLDTIVTGSGSDVVTVGAVGGGGGLVNINTGGGNDIIQFDNSGANPQLTSASIVQGGSGFDFLQIIGGSVNSFDALFTQIRGIEELDFKVVGVSNFLQLDFNAEQNVLSNDTGKLVVQTAGGGSFLSSTFINAGAGFTSPLIFQVGSGGDLGGDNVTTHLGSGPLTVKAHTLDFMQSFESFANTIQPGVAEGIFANTTGLPPGSSNVLELMADGTMAIIDNLGSATSGTHGISKIVGDYVGIGTDLAVALPAGGLSTDVRTVDLSQVHGITAVWGQLATQALTINGGGASSQGVFNIGSDTLVGGSNADSITAHSVWSNGGGVLSPKNFLWGQGGADTLTGVAGAGNTGSNFIFDSLAELKGGDYITNFHGATDSLFLNPTVFVPGLSLSAITGGFQYVGAGATYTDALQLLFGSGTGVGNLTAAVYESDTHMLWIDLNNDGQLNASDAQLHMDFASPPPGPGGLTDFTVTQFNNVTNTSGLFYDSVSQHVIPALILGSANPITVSEWNWFANEGGKVVGTSAQFEGLGGTVTGNPGVLNYDFSALVSGINFTTPAYTGGMPLVGGSVTGSAHNDHFFVSNTDLTSGFFVNGGGEDGGLGDEISIDPLPPLNIMLSSSMIQNVETLDLVVPAGNTISFADGNTGIININDQTMGANNNIDTTHMHSGGVFNLTGGGNQTILLNDQVLGGYQGLTTINLGTGINVINTINDYGALSWRNMDVIIHGGGNTTLNIAGLDITGSTLSGISTMGIIASGLGGAYVVLTGAQWNGIGNVVAPDTNADVRFSSDANITTKPIGGGHNAYYQLFGTTNVVHMVTAADRVSVNGTTNTLILDNIVYDNAYSGIAFSGSGGNHVVADHGTDIHQMTLFDTNGGSVDLSMGLNTAAGVMVTMTNGEHQAFMNSGGIVSHGNELSTLHGTIVITDTASALGSATVQNYVLQSTGGNYFTLGAAGQNVDGHLSTVGETFSVAEFSPTGNLKFGSGTNLLVIGVDDGSATVHSVDLTGATITKVGAGTVGLAFSDHGGDTVKVTSAEYNLFHASPNAITVEGGTNTLQVADHTNAIVLGGNESALTSVLLLSSGATTNVTIHDGGNWAGLGDSFTSTLDLNNTGHANDHITIDNNGHAVTVGEVSTAFGATINNFIAGNGANADQLIFNLVAHMGNYTFISQPLVGPPGQSLDLADHSILSLGSQNWSLASATGATVAQINAILDDVTNGNQHIFHAANNQDVIAITITGNDTAFYAVRTASTDHISGLELVGVAHNVITDQVKAANIG